ncbi:MAG: PilN domain-containing protein [Negativicutes bacterium]|nr:PilN domain-containing protein [Negativicutes bacterium]
MRINFLPQSLRRQPEHSRRVCLLICLIAAALCFLLGSGLLLRQESKKLQQQTELLLQSTPRQELSVLIAERDRLQQEFAVHAAQADVSADRHALPLLAQIMQLLPSAVILQRVDYFENEIELSGSSRQLQEITLLLQNMERQSFYAVCNFTKLQRNSDDFSPASQIWEFTLRLGLAKNRDAS